MNKIIIIFVLIFTVLFCNSFVLADANIKTVAAIAVSESIEDNKDLIRTGIRITIWLFPVIIGIAIIKNINIGKDKK